MTRLYRWLLFLYPADYRATFGAEMAEAFDDAHSESRHQGTWQRATFYLRELAGLAWAASCAQARVHRGMRCVERMRRFANSRAALAALIFMFLGVVAAIEMLKTFALHGRHVRPALAQDFPLEIWEAVVAAYVGGVLGGAIAFLARGTGTNPHADMNARSRQN